MNLDLPFVNNDDHLPFVNNPRNPATPMKRLALLLPLLAATRSPAASEPHAESAENAETKPHADSAERAED